jgi:hypothetical protein
MPRKPGKPGQLGNPLLAAHQELLRRAPKFDDEQVLTCWRAIRDYALHHCLQSASTGSATGTGAMSGLASTAQSQIDTIVDRIEARKDADGTRRSWCFFPEDAFNYGSNLDTPDADTAKN